MKVLLVSTNQSHPIDAGNRTAIMGQVQILKHLGCDVHFLFVEMSLKQSSISQMESYWGNNFHIYYQNTFRKIQRYFTDIIRVKINHGYWKCDDHYPYGLEHFVNSLDRQMHFDAIIIQYLRLSRLLTYISIPRKAIYTHDVFSYKDIRTGGHFYETCNAHEEAKALQRCPNIFAIQEEEATYYKFISPLSRVYTVYSPYIFHNQPIVKNRNILFLSSRMDFNVSGILWFLENIWGKLLLIMPNVELIVGGSVCERIPHNKYRNVVLQGFVESLEDFYAQGNVVINPVYQGTGMKIKTFESLSFGKSTLVHPHSMEGIYKKESAPIFYSSNPEEWVQILCEMLDSKYDHRKNRDADHLYIKNMYTYIENQYKNFLGTSINLNSDAQ